MPTASARGSVLGRFGKRGGERIKMNEDLSREELNGFRQNLNGSLHICFVIDLSAEHLRLLPTVIFPDRHAPSPAFQST